MAIALSLMALIIPSAEKTQTRHHHKKPRMYTQLASWYYDGGQTACGFHARYGVANKRLRCGTRVLFRYHRRSVWAVVQDRGPYAGGRVWDLNQGLAGALGFGGVDYVQASVFG
jgi:rare lipoprotein A (peptidoglycan hydrolase)